MIMHGSSLRSIWFPPHHSDAYSNPAVFNAGEPPAWTICPIPKPVGELCGLMDDGLKLVTMAKNMFNAGYGTAAGAGIKQGQLALHAGPLARPAARKVMIVLSDGNSNFPPDPIASAAAARRAGTEIYIVAVGHHRNVTALQAMASAPISLHLFQAEAYSDLLAALHNATSSVCDRYVCEDQAVCVPAPPGTHGLPLAQCKTTCHTATSGWPHPSTRAK